MTCCINKTNATPVDEEHTEPVRVKTMKIEIEVSEKNEGTSSPWWAIIDPRQNFEIGERGVHNVAGMITGPFFSRESAENFLAATRYNFGRTAEVYCLSGCYSRQYDSALREDKNK